MPARTQSTIAGGIVIALGVFVVLVLGAALSDLVKSRHTRELATMPVTAAIEPVAPLAEVPPQPDPATIMSEPPWPVYRSDAQERDAPFWPAQSPVFPNRDPFNPGSAFGDDWRESDTPAGRWYREYRERGLGPDPTVEAIRAEPCGIDVVGLCASEKARQIEGDDTGLLGAWGD
jgi:hypothetical protein